MAITGYERMGGTSALADIIRERMLEAERKRKEEEEAERRRKQEEQAALIASLRAKSKSAPANDIGPIGGTINKWRGVTPTVGDVQDDVMGLPPGPRTKEQSLPTTSLRLPKTSRPGLDLSVDRVDTGVPSLSASEPFAPTAPLNQTRSQMLPSQDPARPDPVIKPPTQIAQFPSLGQLGQIGPRLPQPGGAPFAAAQPELPRILPQLGKQLGAAIGPAITTLAQSPQLGETVGNFLGGIPGAIANVGTQLGQAARDPGTPLGAEMQMIKLRSQEADRLRKTHSVTNPLAGGLYPKPNFAPIPDNANPMSILANADLMSLLQAAGELPAAIDVPGTGRTLGQLYSVIIGGTVNAVREGQVDLINRPYDSMANLASYWAAANKGVTEVLRPTDEQMKYATPEQIRQAAATSVLMSHHGNASYGEQFDNILDYQAEGQRKIDEGARLAAQADQIGDPRTRQMLLYEAGKLAAEGVKMKDMTPLQLYDKNANFWMALPFEMIFGFDNAMDWISSGSKIARRLTGGVVPDITVAGRRMAQGIKLADMPASAPAQGMNPVEVIKDFMRTQRSDVTRDTYANFNVLTNILASVETVGDAIKIIQTYATDAEKLVTGIPVATLNSPSLILQATDGLFKAGWSGIRDWRAVKAREAIKGLEQWVPHFPSLQGDPTAIVNKMELMGDLVGAMTRSAAQSSTGVLGSISRIAAPYATVKLNVVPQANGQAVVEFIDGAKQVISQSAPMTLSAANKFAKEQRAALKSGVEFNTNWARATADFQRNILSTFTLNTNPGAILTNAIGGYGQAFQDFGMQKELFQPREEQIRYLMNKLGGMFPSMRGAEGVLGIEAGANLATAAGAVPTGARWMDYMTLGLSAVGRKIRQGSGKLGEEGIALNIYYTAFKNFMDREMAPRIAPMVQKILSEDNVTDPQLLKWATDRVVQAGLFGNRTDMAKVFTEIANGRIAPSLRSMHNAFAEVFTGEQVLEIDGLLANLTPQTVQGARTRIQQIMQEQFGKISGELAENPAQAGKFFWTEADDAKDVADVYDSVMYAAEVLGRNPEEARVLAQGLVGAQEQINSAMMQLLNMSADQPGLIKFVYNTWGQIKGLQDEIRHGLSNLAEGIADQSKGARYRQLEDDLPVDPWQVTWDLPREQVFSVGRQLQNMGIQFNLDNNRLTFQVPDGTQAEGLVKRLQEQFLQPLVNMTTREVPVREDMLYVRTRMQEAMGRAFNISEEQVNDVSAIISARMKVWAQDTGRNPQEYLDTFIRDFGNIVPGDVPDNVLGLYWTPGKDNPLAGLIEAGESLLDPDTYDNTDRVAVLIHEIGHAFQYDLEQAAKVSSNAAEEWRKMVQWTGLDASKPWTAAENSPAREKFADAFVHYMRLGRSPIPELTSVFQRFKTWMQTLVNFLRRDAERAGNMASKRTFDSMLTPRTETVSELVPSGIPAPRIVAPERPPLQGPTVPVAPTKMELWDEYYRRANEGWGNFGARAMEIIEQMRTQILDGTAMRNVQEGINNRIDIMATEQAGNLGERIYDLMDDLGVDMEVVRGLAKNKLGWASQDDQFDLVTDQMARGVDKFKAMMFVALSRYPTQKSFDEFMGAFRDVRGVRAQVLGAVNKARKAAETASATGAANASQLWNTYKNLKSSQWTQYFQYAWARYNSGAERIIMVNMNPQQMADLTFSRATEEGWKLVQPSVKTPGAWLVQSPKGGYLEIPVGAGNVPQAAVDAWNNMSALAQRSISEQIAHIAGRVRLEGTGSAQVDEMLRNVPGSEQQRAMMAQIRASVQNWMANYNKPLNIPQDYLQWSHDKLETAGHALDSALDMIAQANGAGMGRLGINSISRFNNEVLPLFDNIITGAQRYADEMVSVDVLDYTNEYHPDVLLGLAVPYHFFMTRMGKNALERLFFHPKWQSQILRFYRALESQNRSEDQPDRNSLMVDGAGVTIGDTTYNVNAGLLARWIPVAPLMVMNGWADPDRANKAYEYAQDAMKEQGWPSTARGAVANIVFYKELAEEMGLGTYPWLDWMEALYTERPQEISLADMGPIPRMMGWAAARFGKAAYESGSPGIMAIQQGFERALTPFYDEYLYGREARNEAQRGNLTDTEASFVQDVAAQRYSGQPAMPEQAALAPNAVDQYYTIRNSVATEYLLREFIRWATGVNVNTTSEAEQQIRADQDLYRDMGYNSNINVAGSQEGKFAMTDPRTEAFRPGLPSANTLYSVMGEQETGEPRRPGLSAARGEYRRERDAIYEKYNAERETKYAANKEAWSNKYAPDDKQAFDDDWELRRDAELAALDARYPTVVENKGERDAGSFAGQRPAESRRSAEQAIYQAANEVAGDVPKGSAPAEYDRQEQRRLAEATRLMQNPGEVDAMIYGKLTPKSPDQGWQIMAPAGATSGQPATPRPIAPEGSSVLATTDPKNQWAAQMAAAEQQYGLPTGLLQELARHESSFNPAARSGVGAMGLMQIMPATWDEWAPKVGATDPDNPEDSIKVSAAYLNWLKNTLPPEKQTPEWILTSYNWGIGRALKADSLEKSPPETQAYVRGILGGLGATAGMANTGTPARYISPVPEGTRVSQPFGANVEYYSKWNGEFGHEGIDFAVPVGTPVQAVADGTVEFAGTGNGFGNYGNYIVVAHPDGNKSYYAHLSGMDVEAGDTVTAGQQIGLSGNTGNSSGPHLHFSLRRAGAGGAYDMIDPTAYLEGSRAAPAAGGAPTVATETGSFDWGKTPEQLIGEQQSRFSTPAVTEVYEAVDQAWVEHEATIKQKYPQYASVYDGYQELATDEERKAYRDAHPEMTAMNLAGNHPQEWEYVEKTFGKGSVEKWALEPPSDFEGGDGARSAYYRKYPDVFLAKSWIQGRPRPITGEPDPNFTYNFGKDYEEAKRLFGDGIWDTVREYYTIPAYVEGAENTEWKAFKNAHPEYDAWRDWWYALMDYDNEGNQRKPYTPFQFTPWGRSGFSGGFSSGGFNSQPAPINRPESRRPEPPAYTPFPTDGRENWRKWMDVPLQYLRDSRR